jgi:glutaredoxin
MSDDKSDALSLSFSLSQKYTIIYLNNNSESEYLKKRNKFLSNSFQFPECSRDNLVGMSDEKNC